MELGAAKFINLKTRLVGWFWVHGNKLYEAQAGGKLGIGVSTFDKSCMIEEGRVGILVWLHY